MRSISLTALKKKLAGYVRLVASGDTVPSQPERAPLLSDPLFAQGVRDGWLTLPALVGHEPPPRKPVMTFRELMHELQHDREG